LAKLEEKKLKPNPAVERRKLIRRVYFDLIGLPPNPEEVDAFVNDKAPDAYTRLIDHLLASPHYGERWGRYWLDTARYSDTKGDVKANKEDFRFPFAWTYRDYVVRAFNEDKPYSRFVEEQVAGDRHAGAQWRCGHGGGAALSDEAAAAGLQPGCSAGGCGFKRFQNLSKDDERYRRGEREHPSGAKAPLPFDSLWHG